MLAACGTDAKKSAPSTTAAVETQCKDGLDNDHDGKADCADPDCQSPGGDCKPAPALNRTVVSTVNDAAAFLYQGDNPLQKDADPTAFDPKRVAMLRGSVADATGKALSGVRVTIQGHKEYGYTLTRSDGAYDLAVNGGVRLLLDFSLDGYLPAQRAVQPGWQRRVVVDDLGLVAATGKTSQVSAEANTSQPITGPVVTDDYGKREPLIIFEPGTVAHAVMNDGSREPLSSLSVTVTEYPFGSSKASPGTSVTKTGVFYGLDFEVAEATKLGASHVEFSTPVSVFVENFLGLPVGTSLPLGYYDRALGQWQNGKTGQVIQILDVTGGTATVDANGDGSADDSATLSGIGITASDLTRLAERYPPSTQLWHGNVAHFSAYQAQIPLNAPAGSVAPTGYGLRTGVPDVPSRQGPILIEPQAINQAIPITGTPYSLQYQSMRSMTYGSGYKLELPVTSDTVPPGLKRITTRLSVGGMTFDGTLDPKPNQTFPVVWDGKDASGRVLQGAQLAELFIGYVYEGVLPNGTKPTKPLEVTLGQTFQIKAGLFDAKAYDLGGFGIDVLHAYDPALHTVYFGYGDQRSADSIALVTQLSNLDSGFNVGTPDSVFVMPDGSILVTDDEQQSMTALGRVLKITADGKPSVVAGPGASGSAAAVALAQPQGIVAMDDGSIIVADYMKNAIRRIDVSGNMTTLVSGVASDNPTVNYTMTSADGLALGPRQELYLVDIDRVMKFEGGTLTTFAGGGTETGDGGLATNAALVEPSAVAISADGIVYITERGGHRIRKVQSDGSITTIAGTGTAGFAGDGLPALTAQLNQPCGIALAPDGSIYFADGANNRIRRITTDGIIQTVIGGGKNPVIDGRLATDIALDQPDGLAVGPDGTLYITTINNVFRVVPGLPDLDVKESLVPSSDGLTLYRFDHSGRHLSTIDAMTGVTELTFGYDASGYLVTITDKNQLVTTIKRASDGTPTSIVGPYGQTTAITISADGNLTQVTDPIARTVQLTWDPTTGVLANVVDPTSKKTTFGYDPAGRLTDVSDPTDSVTIIDPKANPAEHLAPSTTADGFMSVKATTKGKTTEYLWKNVTPDQWQRTQKLPDGTQRDWTDTTSNAGFRSRGWHEGHLVSRA